MIQKRQMAVPAGLHVREGKEGEESREIEGYALKFGVRSQMLSEWRCVFYEVLEPGCVTKEMLDKQDIKLTMFHDRQLILARSKEGAGTLHYEVDKVGVKFWAEMPKTADGDKALELIRRGDISGCSFIYSTEEDDSKNAVSYEKTDEEVNGYPVYIRHVNRIDNIYDFTVTPDPAFEQTEVSRREAEAAGVRFDAKETVDETKKREALKELRRLAGRTMA